MNKVLVVLSVAGVCVAQFGTRTVYQSGGASQYGGAAKVQGYGGAGRNQGYAGALKPQGYGGQGGNQYGRQQGEYSEPAKYSFKYDVAVPQEYLEFGHQEQRDGDNTQGAYQVLLPDGRRQMVEYTVDAYGYHPKVSYMDVSSGSGNYGSAANYASPMNVQSVYQSGVGNGGYQTPSQSGYQSARS